MAYTDIGSDLNLVGRWFDPQLEIGAQIIMKWQAAS